MEIGEAFLVVFIAVCALAGLVGFLRHYTYPLDSEHKELKKAQKERDDKVDKQSAKYVAMGFDNYDARQLAREDLFKEAQQTLKEQRAAEAEVERTINGDLK